MQRPAKGLIKEEKVQHKYIVGGSQLYNILTSDSVSTWKLYFCSNEQPKLIIFVAKTQLGYVVHDFIKASNRVRYIRCFRDIKSTRLPYVDGDILGKTLKVTK